jgi:hypothetical protein
VVAALHIIHSVIQLSTVSEHTGMNPVSLKKLKADEGLCETMNKLLRCEIVVPSALQLGWTEL